mgnify:CR=1 FL=1|tara:strand:+ start:23539 stop:25794 length:2256 start_codon:yes stop_codon:yes gene_type:complete
MASNLTGLFIQDTYTSLVTIDSNTLYTGGGSELNTISNTGLTLTISNLVIGDGSYIGSASDTDAIQIEADGDVVFSQSINIVGTITLGPTVLTTTFVELNYLDGITSAQGLYVKGMNQHVSSTSNIGAGHLIPSALSGEVGTIQLPQGADRNQHHLRVRMVNGSATPGIYLGDYDGDVVTFVAQDGAIAAVITQEGRYSGLAATATLATTATTVTATSNNSTSESNYITFIDGASGAQGIETDTGLRYNPSTGLLSTAAITTTGNVIVGGNLTVSGTTTTVDTANTTVTDSLLELNSGASSNANDSGFIIERGSTGDNALFIWDESTDEFAIGTTTATADSTGNITFDYANLRADNIGIGKSASDNARLYIYENRGNSIPALKIEVEGSNAIEVNDISTSQGSLFKVDDIGDTTIGGDLTVTGGDIYGLKFRRTGSTTDLIDLTTEDQIDIKTLGTKVTRITSDSFTVNNNAADFDFRAKGDTDINLFYVDAGQDKVGVGLQPDGNSEKFSVDGNIATEDSIKIGLGNNSPSARLHINETGGSSVPAIKIDIEGSTAIEVNDISTSNGGTIFEVTDEGFVYSQNEQYWSTTARLQTDDNVSNYFGPNPQGTNYYFWSRDLGTDPLAITSKTSTLNTGWKLPYKAIITGYHLNIQCRGSNPGDGDNIAFTLVYSDGMYDGNVTSVSQTLVAAEPEQTVNITSENNFFVLDRRNKFVRPVDAMTMIYPRFRKTQATGNTNYDLQLAVQYRIVK